MLSETQRDRILDGLGPVTTLTITPIATSNMVNWVPSPPDVLFEVASQGVRQSGFMDLMWDKFDGVTWTEKRGHISRATIKLTIEHMDAKTLEEVTYSIYNQIWLTEAGLERDKYDDGDEILFRGCDPPKFMPPYTEDPTWPFRSVIEYYVDYFDTVTIEVPPIDEIGLTIGDGIEQVITWPEKFYTLDAIFTIVED